jgi:hypothetical protein
MVADLKAAAKPPLPGQALWNNPPLWEDSAKPSKLLIKCGFWQVFFN